MKKNIALIFTTALILNLLPQTSNALRLNEDKTAVIYDAFKDEKEAWEKDYLPHAKYAKLISRSTTVLDIAKMAEKELEQNITYTIIHKIIDTTLYTRKKMILKWEKDNEYVNEGLEQRAQITPTLRRELLKEIREEEENEMKQAEQFSWKQWKTGAKVIGAVAGFVVSMFIKKDICTIAALITTTVTLAATAIDIWEVKEMSKEKDEEEIKLPPLRNMPTIPKNYKRVDVYSL